MCAAVGRLVFSKYVSRCNANVVDWLCKERANEAVVRQDDKRLQRNLSCCHELAEHPMVKKLRQAKSPCSQTKQRLLIVASLDRARRILQYHDSAGFCQSKRHWAGTPRLMNHLE